MYLTFTNIFMRKCDFLSCGLFFCFGSGQMEDAERCICLRVRFLFINKKQGKIQCLKPSFLYVISDERDGEFCKHCKIFCKHCRNF